jgi:Overcoming lysogenization defect protein-like, TOPRIM domain
VPLGLGEADSARAVVLVEGVSDRLAVETLAARRGVNLAAERVSVVAIGGAQAIGSALARFGPAGLDLRLGGFCDAGEERWFRRALERAGLGADLTRRDMERLGFFVCVVNLEDELIRALGEDAVLTMIEQQRELGAFRTYQRQPAHRERTLHEQLWGFMWNRKIRYAPLLVGALDPARVPSPLDGALSHVLR